MPERPRVSFVVPAFNEERLLPACLRAIQAEIKRNSATAEVIVVNNASTDRTREVAEAFEGVVVVDQPAKGLSHARSAGFEASRGVLVANIDADTLVPEGWLDRVLAAFDAPRPAGRKPLVVLSGPYDYYDVPRHMQIATRAFYGVGFCTYLFNKRVLGVGSMVQGGNFVVLRDAMQAIGGISDQFPFYGEDTDIAKRMCAVGEVTFTYDLRAQSSGRRLRGDGMMLTGLRYGLNYTWATFFRKPFTTAWNDYR